MSCSRHTICRVGRHGQDISRFWLVWSGGAAPPPCGSDCFVRRSRAGRHPPYVAGACPGERIRPRVRGRPPLRDPRAGHVVRSSEPKPGRSGNRAGEHRPAGNRPAVTRPGGCLRQATRPGGCLRQATRPAGCLRRATRSAGCPQQGSRPAATRPAGCPSAASHSAETHPEATHLAVTRPEATRLAETRPEATRPMASRSAAAAATRPVVPRCPAPRRPDPQGTRWSTRQPVTWSSRWWLP